MQDRAQKISSTPISLQNRAAAVVIAALLGVFLVAGTGFAGSQVLHNAAHDARHAFAFPCH